MSRRRAAYVGGPEREVEGAGGRVDPSLDGLYRLHSCEALRVARSITHNADDAADAVAEAFTGVLDAVARGRLEGPGAFRPYLLAATRNASFDIVRRAGRLRPTEDPTSLDGAGPGGGPSDRLLAGEDRHLVARAFGELPPRWRAVLWLTEVEGMAPRDAAPLLRLTPNAAAQLAVRARTGLRERYVQSHVRNHATGDCAVTAERLGAFAAGELTVAQANRTKGHLAECAACRSRLAELDDLGLRRRRAALPAPLPALVGRAWRWRWPWSGRAGRGVGTAWLANVDPGPMGTLGGAGTDVLAQVAGSPVVQHVAATVTAGLLTLGVGTAIVRQAEAPARPPEPPAAQFAGPSTTLGPVAALGSIDPAARAQLETTTSTTVTAGPGPGGGPAAEATAPAAFVPAGPLARAQQSSVAHALGQALGIYDTPGAAAARLSLANPRASGAPLVLLVVDQQPGWLKVLLPVRPNGSTGWVRADAVGVVTVDYRIVVELGAHRITAYQGADVLLSEPIGVGTAEAPTPGGLYYLTELFQPAEGPNGPYGPYAYGLSGFSEVLYDFAGGDGQFGIHGTNDPAGLGHDVSHGCIRMSNAGVTRLARILPLGVPVEIRA